MLKARTPIALGRAGWLLAFLSLACAGRVSAFDEAVAGAPAAVPELEHTPTPTSIKPPPNQQSPDRSPYDCASTVLSAEAEWFSSDAYYGLDGPGLLSFSPDGERLATFGHQYDKLLSEFEATSGALLDRVALDVTVYARDLAWRIDLRGRAESLAALHAVESESGKDVADLTPPNATLLGAAISRNGRYAGVVACRGGELVVVRRGLFDDETREVAAGGTCSAHFQPPIFQLVEQGRVALYAGGTTGTVTRIDFASGEVTNVSLQAVTEIVPAVSGLALSSDESIIVSAGALDVRFWSYPDFSPLFEPLPVVAERSFGANCYVSTRYLSALAWSPDGRFVAVPAAGGRLAIRRTCDLELLVELEPEVSAPCASGKNGAPAGLAAFSPSGDQIAVNYSGVVALFRLF